jgi:hypothetical protein
MVQRIFFWVSPPFDVPFQKALLSLEGSYKSGNLREQQLNKHDRNKR